MSLTKISEKFVLNKLKNISQGNLKLINYDGKVFHFGDLESKLSTDIKINNPSFYFNVVLGGSSALGEAYIKKDFYTSNLTDLIELIIFIVINGYFKKLIASCLKLNSFLSPV